MSKVIYGVDSSKEVTPAMVKGAILECFSQAHSEVLELMEDYYKFSSKEEFEKMKKMNVEFVVKSKFEEVDADFENPKKEDLTRVIDKLAELAANFREPEAIKKHYGEIMLLIEKL